jgi:predicted ATP-grasp superfamily ATP-dependent carboligase
METRHNNSLPPAIILGGNANAVSIARSLGRAGILVYAINVPEEAVRYSRFTRWISIPRRPGSRSESWANYLLGPESDHLRNAVLLAANDEALELIAQHRPALSAKYRLDISNPAAQLCMLDKLSTYRAAREAGVPTPRFWVADTREDIERFEDELVFPLMLKPLSSHRFWQHFSGRKYILVRRFEDLLATFDAVSSAKIPIFLVEAIPGADDKLCSYYTYIDEDGCHLFDFTKRVIRRYPVNMGLGSYHITDHVPGVKELALKLFRQVGLRGVANVEFKLDSRDSRLKLIECNARFTAVDCLLGSSGIDLPLFVYRRLVGLTQAPPSTYRVGVRLWDPVRDLFAYRQLNQMRLLSFRGWVRSLLHRQTFAFFRWDDPFPALFDSIRLVMLWRKLESSGSAVATTSSEFGGAPQSMQRDAIPLRD